MRGKKSPADFGKIEGIWGFLESLFPALISSASIKRVLSSKNRGAENMKQSLLFILCVSFISVTAAAQTRQITNADLEKYRISRVKAETELRDNYAKMGFPSPDELEKQNAESARLREELSAKLRQERLERERVEAERRNAAALATQPVIISPDNNSGFYYGFGLSNRFGGVSAGQRFAGGSVPFGVRWRATPGGVIYEPGGRSSFVWTPTFTSVTPRPRPRRTNTSRRGPR